MIMIKKIFSFIGTYWRTLAIFAALIVFYFLISKCSQYKRELADCKAASQFQQLQRPDSIKNASGKKVYEAPVQQTSNADDIKKLSQQYFDLKEKDEKKMKRMQALIVAETKLRVHDTVIQYLQEEIAVNPDSMVRAGDVIMPGRKIDDSTASYKLSGEVEADGFHLKNLEVPNTISFRIGEKSRGWFRSKMLTVQAVNSNKMITITGLKTITLKNPVSWWNRWGKPLAAGAISSLATYKLLK